jgi:hypothetical protein
VCSSDLSELVEPSLRLILEKRVQMSKDKILDPGEIFVQGAIMEYIDTREEE